MAFQTKSPKVKTIWLPVTPSTVLARNSLVRLTSGKLTAVVAATPAVDIVGVLGRAIATTDADYAVDRLVPVIVPTERHVEFEGDVTSGLVAADVGLEVDLTDANFVNRAATAIKAVKCTKVLSATRGLFMIKFNGSY